MHREVTYEIPLPLIRLNLRRHVWKTAGGWLIAMLAMSTYAGIMLMISPGTQLWWVIVILPLCFCGLWIRYYFYAGSLLKDESKRKVTLKVSDQGITTSLSDSESTMKWAAFHGMVRYPDTLALKLGSERASAMLLLPTALIDTEIIDFIERHVDDELATRERIQ